MTINIAYAITAGVKRYKVRAPMLGSEWADKYYYLSAESSGTEGRWKCYPYQIAILNWMTSDDIEEVNFMKSRRVGYTKCLMAAVASLIEQKNRNVAIWQPNDSDAKNFTMDEVNTMLRDVPLLGEKLNGTPGKKSANNTNEKKVFHGATLDIKGGKSAANFRRMTKDVAAYDELAAFDEDIDNEGSATELGDGRLDQAPFPKSIRGSTAKTKGICQIESAVENSDMVFYRYVPCPHCGTLQRLEFKNLECMEENDPDTTRYICKQNGCVIEYRDYTGTMDKAGRWQTLDGNYYDDASDRFFNALDEQIPKPRRIGAKIWAGYSHLKDWAYLMYKYIKALEAKARGSITALKTFVNTLMGETWEERGESVDAEEFSDRTENYHFSTGIPNDVLLITAGVDVQGGKNSRIELEILGHGLDLETWSIDYISIPGDPEQRHVWDHLDAELKRRFVREDGVELGVAAAFVDSGYLASHVYRFTAPRKKRMIFATKGVNNGSICNKATTQSDKKKKVKAILHTVNVDDAKEITYRQLKNNTEPGPGFCHFPAHYESKYFKMLANEVKVEKRKHGRLIGHEWRIKQAHLGNEPVDCRSYALGALYRLNPKLEAIRLTLLKRAAVIASKGEKLVFEKKPENLKEAVEQIVKKVTEKIIKKPKRKPKPRRKKGGFVNGY